MFKKKCTQCQEKIEKSHKFCPFCGYNLISKNKYNNEDYGFLGRDDFDESNFESMFNNFPIRKLFKTAIKMTEKMMKNLQEPNQPKQFQNNSNMDVQFFVNGKRVFPQKRQVQPQQQKINQEIFQKKAQQLAKLPRKEPKTTMKRLSGKLIYEFAVPGVQDINDILINQLESSIEIKALSKNRIYSKTLNLNLPIIGYGLNNENLILELQAR